MYIIIRNNKKKFILISTLLLLSSVFLLMPVRKYVFDAIYVDRMKLLMNFNPGQLKGVPIITYHCIDDNIFGEKDMFVSPKVFDEQMKYLYDSGYTPITFSQLNQLQKIKKPILITMDDGYEDNYRYAYPVLKKYNFHATIFLITNSLEHGKFLKINQIHEMSDLIDFESHTVHHQNLSKLSDTKVEYEVKESKNALEKLLSKKIIAIAYPFGAYNRNTISAVKGNYQYGITIEYPSPPGWYTIKRIPIYDYVNIDAFRDVIATKEPYVDKIIGKIDRKCERIVTRALS